MTGLLSITSSSSLKALQNNNDPVEQYFSHVEKLLSKLEFYPGRLEINTTQVLQQFPAAHLFRRAKWAGLLLLFCVEKNREAFAMQSFSYFFNKNNDVFWILTFYF